MSARGLPDLVAAGERIHLVGIGGAGMSALALLLQARGATVTGSDRQRSPGTDDLGRHGITVHIGHAAENARGCACLVHTAAVSEENPEVEYALAAGVQVLKRSEALAQMVNAGRLIGVAGTHGKTTTTALVSVALEGLGLDPTALVGGRLEAWGGNARIGGSEYYVVEADEYDRSFLTLKPYIAIVTSMEPEHLDTYGTADAMETAFGEFVDRVPTGGRVVACADDAGAARCLARAGERGLGYGIDADAPLKAKSIELDSDRTRFEARYHGGSVGRFDLALHGKHNVRNTLAALGVLLALGLDPKAAAPALAAFEGAERRFQLIGEEVGVTVIDDYAHHPTEVRATLEAMRQIYGDRRALVVFQPHLFTRTRALAAEFGAALAAADVVFLPPIYPAREDPIPGVDSGLVAEAARRGMEPSAVRLPTSLDAAVDAVAAELRAGDVVLTLGAGDVDQVGRRVLERLRRSHVDA